MFCKTRVDHAVAGLKRVELWTNRAVRGHSQVTRGHKVRPKKWGRRFRLHWTYSALAEAASDLSKQNIAKAAVTFDVQIYHNIKHVQVHVHSGSSSAMLVSYCLAFQQR